MVMSKTISSGIELSLGLRVGDIVEVRSVREILSTLDENFCLDSLPYMPEMMQYSGRWFRVYKSAHKTCDTICTYSIRRMTNTVHLEGLRCDGEGHGGCQAGCLLFWKEAWLRRVSADGHPSAPEEPAARTVAEEKLESRTLEALLASAVRPSGKQGGPVSYRCQATELRNASIYVWRWARFNPLLYVRDLTSGNVKLFDFIRFGLLAAFNAFCRFFFRRRYPFLRGTAGKSTPTGEVGFRPGDLVHVLPKEEIMRTLDSRLRNRGLGFDVEMLPFCNNGPYKVLRRVEKIINEQTGEMMLLPNPCIILDNVTCSGNYSMDRMFCPRAIYPYFREIWLKRAEQAGDGVRSQGSETNS
jgi:hypothetical protein